jgi:translation elongation factor EF-Tu-like GTPase
MRFLMKVEDVFEVKKRGIVVSGRVNPNHSLSTGDAIELRNGSEPSPQVRVAGIQVSRSASHLAILLAEPIQKSDVPIGSEIWQL